MATFVLVPGAWHGAWCYKRVTPLLRQAGHEVYPLTLTGLADRSHLCDDSVNLSTHIDDVVNLLQWEELSDVILVGHSYAGVVLGGVAEKAADRLGALVFLDAFMPAAGQSMIDISPREVPDTGTLPPYTAAGMKVNEADQAWVDAMVTPQPVHTYTEPLDAADAYLTVARKVYVRTTFPSAGWQAAYEQYSADPAWETHLVDCGHDLMIDKPAELAQILLGVA
ncbi:MAG: alpha/beta hydrolase [Propionibacteriaceae bacterium]|nr:alpha/beta hydrolase [Propionibacteriaceae bacterium]